MAISNPGKDGTDISPGQMMLAGNGLQQRLNAANAFFGPGGTLAPVVPDTVPVRAFDYDFGTNLQTTRPYSPVPWYLLRRFAREYPLLAMAINHMKDRICSKRWVVRVKKLPGETALAHQTRNTADPRVAQVTQLISMPDGENDYRTWVRKLLDDYYVIDAACIAPERLLNGTIYRLIAADGATIVRKIDAQGMTPSGFTQPDANGKRTPLPAYQQVIKGVPYKDLSRAQLLYMAENIQTDRVYGYSRVEMVLQLAILGAARLSYQSDYYESGNTPDMIAFLDEEMTPEDTAKWDALYRKYMEDVTNRRKVFWMPNAGRDPFQLKKEELTDKMDEMLNRLICFVFGISPSALVPQVNRAAGQQMADDADESGETPVSEWLAGHLNRLIQLPIYLNMPDLELAFEDQPEVDHASQSTIDTAVFAIANAVGAGEQYYNEMRERDGKPPADIKDPPEDNAGQDDNTGGGNGGSGGDGKDGAASGGSGGSGAGKPSRSKAKAVKPGKSSAAAATLTIDPGIETKAKAKAAAAISKALQKLFAAEKKRLATDIAAQYARQRRTKAASISDDDAKAIADAIMAEIDIDWSSAIPDLSRSILRAATDGVAVAGTQLGLDDHDIFSQANEWAISYAEERGAELVGMKLVNGEYVTNPNAEWAITETTRDVLQNLLVDALKEGDSIAMLTKSIQTDAAFSKSRADMVATTETNFANAGGQMELGRLVGHTHKRSLLSGDHDQDDICDINADADDLDIDEPFPDGSMNSPFHPRCVCLTQTFVPGEEF